MRQMRMNCVLGAAFVSLGLIVAVARADISGGLVGHWKFDEEQGTIAQDSSGNNYDATLFGDPTWAEGKVRGGLDLDGTNDYVGLPIGSLLASLTNSTFAGWVNFSNAGGAWQRIFDFGSGETINMFLTPRRGTADSMRFAITIGGSGAEQMATAPAVLASGWHHVAVTIDADNDTIRLYLDGVVVAENTAATLTPSDLGETTQNWLGRSQYVADGYLDGALDDFRIYSRALSGADIVELLNWTGGANAGKDFRAYGGDKVTLRGSGPSDATSVTWAQSAGTPTVTLETTADRYVVQFDAPTLEIGTLLTFRLTVVSPSEGTTSDDVKVIVTAVNPPKVAPGDLRVYPVDRGAQFGFRVAWTSVLDAEKYQGALKMGTQYIWLYNTTDTYMDFLGMGEGLEQTVAIRGENKFSIPGSTDPSKHGLQSVDVTFKAMRNLALPASLQGAYPPSAYVFKVQPSAEAGLNNLNPNENVSSAAVAGKLEDYWGYTWDQARYFDRIVYYTGEFGTTGGWFTSLKVQYTTDGTNWIDIVGAQITPPYDFTDSVVGRAKNTRYDLTFPAVRGTGVRIYGTPGGMDQFTTVGELEVYGDQTRPSVLLLVQGVDASYPEGGTATLDGSYTFSTRGPITSWQWEKMSGPDVTINNSTSAKATFTAPVVTSDTVMVFKLTAGDGTETLSDSDVQITIKNLATAAVAGRDQRVLEGTQVTLNGSGSMSTTGTLTYLWTQTGGTSVGVTGSTSKTPSFTAPILWGFMEELKFKLDVDDGSGGTSTDEVLVTVYNFAGLVSPLGPGYIKDLLHMGETAADRVTAPLTVTTDHLKTFGGEAVVNPRPDQVYDFTGTNVTVTTNPAVWTPLHDAAGWFGDEGVDNFVQIYHIYIISPTDRDVQWHFRHDDEIRAFNNGVMAFGRDGWDPGSEIVRFGPAAQRRGLDKGINSVTFKFHDGTGANYVAVGVTDVAGNPFTDLQYSLGLPVGIADAYAARILPDSYEPNGTVDVNLSFRVNPANTPGSVTIREVIPPGIPEGNITAPGAIISGGGITWTLSGSDVKTRTITYSFTVPAEMTQGIDFAGTVSFGTTSADIIGEDVVYAVPSEPLYLIVEMLMAAHLSWAPPATEGTATYNVFRNVNGGTWEQIGSTTTTSFVDSTVTDGNNYSYAVSAIGVNGIEGPQSSPTAQAQLPAPGTFQIREAEDFNYDGGKFPWTSAVTVPALEAPSATEIGTPQQYDYYHPDTGGPGTRTYRPLDNRTDGTGVAINISPQVDDPSILHTKIGWTTVGSWYRFGFDVAQAGWIKLTFCVACPDGGTIAAYWDETLVGTASYRSGNWDSYTWAAIEQFEETDTGVHYLRVAVLSGQLDFDKIAIGFNWAAPKRETIWSDNFDAYSSDADVKAGGWTIENGSSYPDAAWRLWDTDGTMGQLGNQDPNLPGMYDKYMVTDSDLAPDATLDERLISKDVDCTNHMKVRLNFSKNYNAYPDDPDHLQVAEVDIQVFDNGVWGNWVNLGHWDRLSGSSSTPEQVDISSLADKKKIRLRWHFSQAKWDYWFAIDQVRVSGEALPTEAKITKLTPAAGKLTLNWTVFGTKQYTVQQTDNLVGGTWAPAPGTWPTSEQTWTSGDLSGTKKLFYRVMGQ